MRNDGKVFCPEHPTVFYDPKKYSKCFYCFAKERGLKKCAICGQKMHKPEFDMCYDCSQKRAL